MVSRLGICFLVCGALFAGCDDDDDLFAGDLDCGVGRVKEWVGSGQYCVCKEGTKPGANGACEPFSCPKGYEQERGDDRSTYYDCVDIDECADVFICTYGHCVNKEGSYTCNCTVGEFNGETCVDTEEKSSRQLKTQPGESDQQSHAGGSSGSSAWPSYDDTDDDEDWFYNGGW